MQQSGHTLLQNWGIGVSVAGLPSRREECAADQIGLVSVPAI